jgi:hypothetical protein
VENRSHVAVQVGLEGVFPCERFSTEFAQKGFIPRVDAQVASEGVCLCERFSTVFAGIGFSHSEESKTYVCDYIINTVNGRICNKQLLGKAELTEHMKIHTKNKFLICSYCSKAFAQRGEQFSTVFAEIGFIPGVDA